jgi:uncharacterized protein
MRFEWDENKNRLNIQKHGVSFTEARSAFYDHRRIIKLDVVHSGGREKRYFCFGKVGQKIMTVRFTLRKDAIRIFGAGYWRSGRKHYFMENKGVGNGSQKV